tara:strand:- start:912 stop:1499 length:588 start_codon:yes stop_codon:yes gene_type:complete
MSEINLLDDVAPASNELGAISDMAQQMYDLQEEIMKMELSLKQKKQDLDKLATQDLPDLMQELNLKNFTLNNGAKVLVDDVLSGSIPSASSILRAKGEDKMEKEMRQEQCFDWLRANGGSDLIKSNVEVQFGRDEDQLCNDFTKELQDRSIHYRRAVGVHPATLNSFLKEKIESGANVPRDTFKLFEGRKAKIRR